MGLCSSQPRGPPGGYDDDGQGYGEPPAPPESPSWKLPPFPAPALPPLTRQNKIIIAASRYIEDEDEKTKTKKCVLNGMGEALSIVFGASVRPARPERRELIGQLGHDRPGRPPGGVHP